MNILYSLQQESSVLIAVFAILITMSIASWYIIFRKILVIKLERKSILAFRLKYLSSPELLLSSLKISNERMVEEKCTSSIYNIITEVKNLQGSLAKIDEKERKEVLSMHLAQVLDTIKICLDSGLTLLASVSNSAPFIGLFGTVWGIYGALIKISEKGSAGLSVVAAPMGEALTATAVGLFAAIPAAIAYNIFLRYNRLIIQDLRHIAEQFSMYASNLKNK